MAFKKIIIRTGIIYSSLYLLGYIVLFWAGSIIINRIESEKNYKEQHLLYENYSDSIHYLNYLFETFYQNPSFGDEWLGMYKLSDKLRDFHMFITGYHTMFYRDLLTWHQVSSSFGFGSTFMNEKNITEKLAENYAINFVDQGLPEIIEKNYQKNASLPQNKIKLKRCEHDSKMYYVFTVENANYFSESIYLDNWELLWVPFYTSKWMPDVRRGSTGNNPQDYSNWKCSIMHERGRIIGSSEIVAV
jgi:hypothetical protein